MAEMTVEVTVWLTLSRAPVDVLHEINEVLKSAHVVGAEMMVTGMHVSG